MNKEYEVSLWENNPFIDGLFEWMDSPRGLLSDEVREDTWQRLEKVDVDAADRKLIWEDGKRLSIDESVQRIRGDYPDFPAELIETHLIAWLEMEFAPKSYSRVQLDELDRLTEKWVNAYYSQRQAALK
jgi:hypothetical protein